MIPNTVNSWRSENQTIFSASQLGLTTPTDTDIAGGYHSRDDNVDFTIAGGSNQNFTASVDGEDSRLLGAFDNRCNDRCSDQFIRRLG